MKKIFFLIIFLLTCKSAQVTDVSPPEDFAPAIEKAEKFLQTGGSGDYKDSFLEMIQSLKQCNEKQKELYSAIQTRETKLQDLKEEFDLASSKILKLSEEKEKISQELAVWETRELIFWICVSVLILGSLIYTFRTPILFIIKKAAGIPL